MYLSEPSQSKKWVEIPFGPQRSSEEPHGEGKRVCGSLHAALIDFEPTTRVHNPGESKSK
jgi:hypothetical protein